jgi:hypothetical protein
MYLRRHQAEEAEEEKMQEEVHVWAVWAAGSGKLMTPNVSVGIDGL